MKSDREAFQDVCVAVGDCLTALIAYAGHDSTSNKQRVNDTFHRLGGRVYDWVEPDAEDL